MLSKHRISKKIGCNWKNLGIFKQAQSNRFLQKESCRNRTTTVWRVCVVDNGAGRCQVWGIFRRDFVFGNIGLRLFENSKILPIAANFFEIRCLESIGRRRERIYQWW